MRAIFDRPQTVNPRVVRRFVPCIGDCWKALLEPKSLAAPASLIAQPLQGLAGLVQQQQSVTGQPVQGNPSLGGLTPPLLDGLMFQPSTSLVPPGPANTSGPALVLVYPTNGIGGSATTIPAPINIPFKTSAANGPMVINPTASLVTSDFFGNGTNVHVNESASSSLKVSTFGSSTGNSEIGLDATMTESATWSNPPNSGGGVLAGVGSGVGTGNRANGTVPISWDIENATGNVTLYGNITVSFLPTSPQGEKHLTGMARG